MTGLQIRKGRKEDLGQVLELVRELAVYEKAPFAVTATHKDYQDHFEEIFEVLLAEMDAQVVGIALYYPTFSTWKGKMIYLEDFIITQKYRQQGIGQLLFERVVQESKDAGAKLLKWQVLEWNAPAIDFYRKYEVEQDGEWLNMKLML